MESIKIKLIERLRTMADALEELQLSLKPVMDKALDHKAFYTGYAQCAEQMIEVIVAKMDSLRNEAELNETNDPAEDEVVSTENKMEAPLIVDPVSKCGEKKKE